MVAITTQTDHIEEVKPMQVEVGTQRDGITQADEGTQTEVGIEELDKGMERKRERKGKARAKGSDEGRVRKFR